MLSSMSEIRTKYLGEKAGEDPDAIEDIQLVIPPSEANHLIGFVSQVEKMLGCSIRQVVGSWQEGIAIIFSFGWAIPLADILNKLAEIPEVEEIVEKPPPRKLLKKAMSITTINNPKTILVTLKHG